MSETFPEGTQSGTDYGSTVDRIETTDADPAGNEERTEGGAVPDDPAAERAQEGVQESFDAH